MVAVVLSKIISWLPLKWRLMHTEQTLQAFPATFNSLHGQLVLQYLLDNIYCTVYEGTDPIGLANHNGQRQVVHLILEHIDRAQQPAKYAVMEAQHNGSAS